MLEEYVCLEWNKAGGENGIYHQDLSELLRPTEPLDSVAFTCGKRGSPDPSHSHGGEASTSLAFYDDEVLQSVGSQGWLTRPASQTP